ncbi:MAG: FAD-dependent oxidoreductase [Desulfobacterales bacterium]|jgi:choline dehydrogenase-like flavoprotein|nr:FAD-dependent oxidoreductase [Desulfobacterales bacterium]
MNSEVIVVGSGAGGATVARELSRKIKGKILLLESGNRVNTKQAYTQYENYLTPPVEGPVHEDMPFWPGQGLEIARLTCVGGTTLVTAGTCVRKLEDELKKLGIDLSHEFESLEHELKVNNTPDWILGRGTKKILEACESLGYDVTPMPKFIDFSKCKSKLCGNCTLGCPENAKWNALEFLTEAEEHGLILQQNTRVDRVLIKNKRVVGVRANGRDIFSRAVVLAAGAIGTPLILRASGCEGEIGKNLFVNTYVTVGGIMNGVEFNKEVAMGLLINEQSDRKLMLAPHYARRIVKILTQRGLKVKEEDVIGIMVKIGDENQGEVKNDGTIVKYLTENDFINLSDGVQAASDILEEAGVNPLSIVCTNPRGAHPGGTARIGGFVRAPELETEIEGLYIADASLLPESTGGPPILTIMALAKRIARNMLDQQEV